MKSNSVWAKLGRFRNHQDNKGAFIFTSRVPQNYRLGRMVKVVDQGENVVCLPIVVEADGTEHVAFHAKTIKSLVDFLEGR